MKTTTKTRMTAPARKGATRTKPALPPDDAPVRFGFDPKHRAKIRRLMAEKPAGSWTVDDYMALPDDGNRYEVLEGNLYMCPCSTRRHQQIQMNLTRHLLKHIDAGKLGELYCAPFDVVYQPRNCFQPDLLFVRSDRLGIIDAKNVKGPPDLAIEILSPGNRKHDVVRKRGVYARMGIANFWIVDPDEGSIEEFVLMEGGDYRVGAVLAKEEPELRPRAFPDLVLRYEEVFPDEEAG